MLDDFWRLAGNANRPWRDAQGDYYRFMQERGFVVGNAARPEKDAREKTSGLAALGLLDYERRLTAVGRKLLRLSLRGAFDRNNPLDIPADSFIYLRQLLKAGCDVNGDVVRPFAVLVCLLLQLGQLADDEFTYLLPLCTTRENTLTMVGQIRALRAGAVGIDDIIKNRLLAMDNYGAALSCFLSEPVSETVIVDIGMNRKSGGYDRAYWPFYNLLRRVALDHDGAAVLPLYEQTKNLKGKAGALWRQFLFAAAARSVLRRDGMTALADTSLLRCSTEEDFKRWFFAQMHLFKAKATLGDYADLNRRYFKTTDTVLFEDGIVKLDILPDCWLREHGDGLLALAFSATNDLPRDIQLPSIAPWLAIDEQRLYSNLRVLYGIEASSPEDVREAMRNKRRERFDSLIGKRFTRDKLVSLLEKFETRDDGAIRQLVTNNADMPTIFEYIVAVAWHVVSECQGDVLQAMNLSLGADLLPRTHAKGGMADIEYGYGCAGSRPEHTLLIEATLTADANQRHAEMEPVSRHLGEFLKRGNRCAYCLFVATSLYPQLVADFRSWRTRRYYGNSKAGTDIGLKIIPLDTKALRAILGKGITYAELYRLLDEAYLAADDSPQWYDSEIVKRLKTARNQQPPVRS